MKISQAFDEYVEYHMKMKGLASNYIKHYGYCRDSLIGMFGDIDIERIRISHVAMWKNQLLNGRQINTVRAYIEQLRIVLRYCKIHGVDVMDPDEIAVPKRTPVVPDWLTPEEVARMIDSACSLRSKAMISLLYGSGIRLSEMLSLNKSSIQDGQFTVVGKGGRVRICYADDRTLRLIDRYIKTRTDKCPALFVSKYKTRMTATNVQMAVKNAASAAGITKNVHPHALRHGFATNYLHNEGNMRHLSRLLGHASLNTTAHYTHIEDADLKKQYCKYHTV